MGRRAMYRPMYGKVLALGLAAASFAACDDAPRTRPSPSIAAPALASFAGAGVDLTTEAARFEREGDHVRVAFAGAHAAGVAVPLSAGGNVRLVAEAAAMHASFALRATSDVALAYDGKRLVYPGAARGADVVLRVHAEGVEDHVLFEHKPDDESLTYDVDVSGAAGLRFVSNTLELLDGHGAPRLRVAPPEIVEANGAHRRAELRVQDCAVDTSTIAPWGRPVTRPGRSTCAVTVSWSSRAYPVLVDPNWTTTGSLAVARGYLVPAPLADGRILFPSGFVASQYVAVSEIYDPVTKTFAMTGAMNDARRFHRATPLSGALAGRVLVTGGDDALASWWSDSVELYDPATGAFTLRPPMRVRRGIHTATLLADGRVHLAGGQGTASGITLKDAEIYDPVSGTSVVTGALKIPRSGHEATMLANGKVFVAAGCEDPSACRPAEVFDPSTGVFTKVGSMSLGRGQGTAQALLPDGKVLVCGGQGPQAYTATAEVFDPATGTFSDVGSMLFSRLGHTATRVGSGTDAKILIVGGGGSTVHARTEVFDYTTQTFAEAGTSAQARILHGATPIAGNGVLVVGGMTGNSFSATAEIFRLLPAGERCTVGDGECASGSCQGGVCCASKCTGTCMTCTPGTGACVAVKNATDPASCRGTCDAAGACKKDDGEVCNDATECSSGHCVDGVCCNTTCNGVCQACDLIAHAGKCSLVDMGAPHGARACPGQGPCAGTCDGTRADACTSPGAETACVDGCADGYRTKGACDGNGACSGSRDACDGFFGCVDAKTCKTVCQNDADCAKNATCDTRTARCVPGGTCEGANTRKKLDGTIEDCGSYACRSGACLTECSAASDCVGGAACVQGVQGARSCRVQDNGGCSTSGPTGLGLSPLAGLAIYGMIRRRKRKVVR